ncbi:MAG: hypothetical protein JWN68_2489 [Nocardioides sp.]|jgi:hypothetical protein|nr:hypothetical protein [Nocardioides sp.]
MTGRSGVMTSLPAPDSLEGTTEAPYHLGLLPCSHRKDLAPWREPVSR